MEPLRPDPQAVRALARLFQRNGFVRWQDPRRLAAEGWGHYKKGDELRLVARSAQELRLVRRLLRKAGFEPGRPFAKGRQFGQPIYGRRAVARFLELIGAQEDV
jgi:hypothetical protein